MATIKTIKEELKISSLEFFPVMDKDETGARTIATDWHRAVTLHGDTVIVHTDTLETLKKDTSISGLFLKRKEYPDFFVFILCIGSKTASGVI